MNEKTKTPGKPIKEPDKNITPEMVDAILEKGVDFNINVINKNLLHKLRILPSSKTFIIYPLTLSPLLEVSKLLSSIDPKQLEVLKENKNKSDITLQQSFQIIVDNKDIILQAIAWSICNKKSEPSDSLITFLNDNLTSRELLRLLILVVKQMGVQHFLASMVSIVGLDLFEAKKEE